MASKKDAFLIGALGGASAGVGALARNLQNRREKKKREEEKKKREAALYTRPTAGDTLDASSTSTEPTKATEPTKPRSSGGGRFGFAEQSEAAASVRAREKEDKLKALLGAGFPEAEAEDIMAKRDELGVKSPTAGGVTGRAGRTSTGGERFGEGNRAKSYLRSLDESEKPQTPRLTDPELLGKVDPYGIEDQQRILPPERRGGRITPPERVGGLTHEDAIARIRRPPPPTPTDAPKLGANEPTAPALPPRGPSAVDRFGPQSDLDERPEVTDRQRLGLQQASRLQGRDPLMPNPNSAFSQIQSEIGGLQLPPSGNTASATPPARPPQSFGNDAIARAVAPQQAAARSAEQAVQGNLFREGSSIRPTGAFNQAAADAAPGGRSGGRTQESIDQINKEPSKQELSEAESLLNFMPEGMKTALLQFLGQGRPPISPARSFRPTKQF